MKFTVYTDVEAAFFEYFGFELTSFEYDVPSKGKKFVFSIEEETQTYAGVVRNDPVKLLEDFNNGESTVGDPKALLESYDQLVRRVIKIKQDAIIAFKNAEWKRRQAKQRQQPKKVTA